MRAFSRFLLAAISAVACAQPRLEFEVATIKPNPGEPGKAYVQPLPGRLLMQNFTVRTMSLLAYGVEDYQISGAPSWFASDRFDVQATAAGDASAQQMEGPMLQALLEDRFHLSLHRETKEMPAYELTAIGKSKLQPTKDASCTPYPADAPPPRAPAPGQPWPRFCGYFRSGAAGPSRTLDGTGISMATLANTLTRAELHKPVVDRTGLMGTFDVLLTWTPDSLANPTNPDAPAGTSIFTALKEQLGLKLDSARAPVEVLVIDRLEKPSAN